MYSSETQVDCTCNTILFEGTFLKKKCPDLVIYTAFIFFTDSVFIILCPFQLSTFFGLFWLMNHEACPKLIMADHHFVPFFLCLVAIYSKYPFLSWDRLKEQKVMHVAYNISSVVEFQKWWVLKSKLFAQKSTSSKEILIPTTLNYLWSSVVSKNQSF